MQGISPLLKGAVCVGGMQVNEYVTQHFGFAYSFRGWVVLILLGFVLLFRVGSIVAVTKLSYVKR